MGVFSYLPRLAASVLIALAASSGAAAQDSQPAPMDVRLAAGWIGQVLDDVAASTEAVGHEFAAAFGALAPASEAEAAEWQARAQTQRRTTAFRTWPAAAPAPLHAAAAPALYSYGESAVSPERAARLAALRSLVPVLRAAHRSFDFAWVYLTTADGLMLIYPYVPLDEAVNNDPPTQQVFYTAADIGRRAVGWTPPYLDLVGAGMMVTASSPVFLGDELIGVAARDITLDELSMTVLARLAQSGGATALLVDGRGVAIGASAPDLRAEIEQVNSQAGSASLFYRSEAELDRLAIGAARSSTFGWVNEVVDRVIAGEGKAGGDGAQAFEAAGRAVRAAAIPSTGWFVILVSEGS